MCQQWDIQAEHIFHGMSDSKAESRANIITKYKVESVCLSERSQYSYTSCFYVLLANNCQGLVSFFFKGISDFYECPLSMTLSGK